MRYDPDKPVDPEEWLETDEQLGQIAVIDYHREARVKLPNINVHAHRALKGETTSGDLGPAYLEDLQGLTKKSWYEEFGKG